MPIVEIDITGIVRQQPRNSDRETVQTARIKDDFGTRNDQRMPDSPDIKLQITITAKDNSTGKLLPDTVEHTCFIPLPTQNLRSKNLEWKNEYTKWLKNITTLIESPAIPIADTASTISVSQKCQNIGRESIGAFNEWISYENQIKSALLSVVSSKEYKQNRHDFRFILRTRTGDRELDLELQRLPFHTWEFLKTAYPDAEIALSTNNHAVLPVIHHKPQILVIVGNDPKIDLIPHQESIGRNIPADLADVRYWPSTTAFPADPIADLIATLNASSPQVVIFIGHSQSTMPATASQSPIDAAIRIWLSPDASISLEDSNFQEILRELKNRGLIFAAFISCDGLRIAPAINALGIPYVLVSREILPVHIAKILLDRFLSEAVQPDVPIHIALSYARKHLQATVEHSQLEGCPNASNFPVIFQIPDRHSYFLNPKSTLVVEPKSPQQLADRIVRAVNIQTPRTWKIALCSALLIFIPFSIFKTIEIWQQNSALVKSTPCDESIKGLVYLSCGEKSMFGDKYLDLDAKQGMEELRLVSPNYTIAVEWLERSWKNNQENPEVLIALSNARIKLAQQQAIKAGQPQPLVKTISVVVPASFKSNEEKYLPISLLAAVAEAQRGWNDRNSNNWSLEVMVGNDDNDPEIAKKQVVKEILARPMIFGTLGHYSSYVTEGVLPLYQAKKSMLISATNTATDLGKNNRFFVRTVSSNHVQASLVVEFLKRRQISEVELIHGTRIYATTFTNNLITIAKKNNIRVHPSVLTSDKLNAHTVMNNLARHKSKLLILAPDAFIDATDRDNMRQIITKNAGKIPIIGNEVVNEPWLFGQIEQQQELGQNLMFVFAWNNVVDRQHFSPGIYAKAPKWWQDKHQKISHRTVLMYDAAKVLIESIDFGVKANMTDRDIKAKLPDLIRRIRHTGMTGEINFNGSDRKEDLQGLVKPKFDEQGKLIGFQAPENN
jgi:ABC-type branched-subunit amino acid transport system substrate-binding protein